jgi:hypothetical protein
MKEKIEEIIERKLRYCPEVREADIYRVHRYRVEELKGEISTLIQEEMTKPTIRGETVCKSLNEHRITSVWVLGDKNITYKCTRCDEEFVPKNLIQEERKEAVRGLIEYLEVNTEKVFYLGCGKMINEYLGTVESEK